MTTPPLSDVAVVTAPGGDRPDSSYVDWPAILAGIVLASAISLVLLAFGSAVGLSFTSFNAREGVSFIWVGIAAASWLLWVQVSSFMAGAYVTGRLRKRHFDATPDEVDVRDGAHGLLVWGGSLVIGAIIAVGGLGAAAGAIGSTAATLTNAASNVAGDAVDGVDPSAYFVDALFRSGPATPAATAGTAPGTAAPTDTALMRDEAGRILAQGALAGEVSADDRTYLGQQVARATGLPEAEATARVDQVLTSVDQARAAAADAAEEARKTGVLAAFLIAASLLVSAAGAFWAAQKGGQHRDENTVFAGVFRRF